MISKINSWISKKIGARAKRYLFWILLIAFTEWAYSYRYHYYGYTFIFIFVIYCLPGALVLALLVFLGGYSSADVQNLDGSNSALVIGGVFIFSSLVWWVLYRGKQRKKLRNNADNQTGYIQTNKEDDL